MNVKKGLHVFGLIPHKCIRKSTIIIYTSSDSFGAAYGIIFFQIAFLKKIYTSTEPTVQTYPLCIPDNLFPVAIKTFKF